MINQVKNKYWVFLLWVSHSGASDWLSLPREIQRTIAEQTVYLSPKETGVKRARAFLAYLVLSGKDEADITDGKSAHAHLRHLYSHDALKHLIARFNKHPLMLAIDRYMLSPLMEVTPDLFDGKVYGYLKRAASLTHAFDTHHGAIIDNLIVQYPRLIQGDLAILAGMDFVALGFSLEHATLLQRYVQQVSHFSRDDFEKKYGKECYETCAFLREVAMLNTATSRKEKDVRAYSAEVLEVIKKTGNGWLAASGAVNWTRFVDHATSENIRVLVEEVAINVATKNDGRCYSPLIEIMLHRKRFDLLKYLVEGPEALQEKIGTLSFEGTTTLAVVFNYLNDPACPNDIKEMLKQLLQTASRNASFGRLVADSKVIDSSTSKSFIEWMLEYADQKGMDEDTLHFWLNTLVRQESVGCFLQAAAQSKQGLEKLKKMYGYIKQYGFIIDAPALVRFMTIYEQNFKDVIGFFKESFGCSNDVFIKNFISSSIHIKPVFDKHGTFILKVLKENPLTEKEWHPLLINAARQSNTSLTWLIDNFGLEDIALGVRDNTGNTLLMIAVRQSFSTAAKQIEQLIRLCGKDIKNAKGKTVFDIMLNGKGSSCAVVKALMKDEPVETYIPLMGRGEKNIAYEELIKCFADNHKMRGIEQLWREHADDAISNKKYETLYFLIKGFFISWSSDDAEPSNAVKVIQSFLYQVNSTQLIEDASINRLLNKHGSELAKAYGSATNVHYELTERQGELLFTVAGAPPLKTPSCLRKRTRIDVTAITQEKEDELKECATMLKKGLEEAYAQPTISCQKRSIDTADSDGGAPVSAPKRQQSMQGCSESMRVQFFR